MVATDTDVPYTKGKGQYQQSSDGCTCLKLYQRARYLLQCVTRGEVLESLVTNIIDGISSTVGISKMYTHHWIADIVLFDV